MERGKEESSYEHALSCAVLSLVKIVKMVTIVMLRLRFCFIK